MNRSPRTRSCTATGFNLLPDKGIGVIIQNGRLPMAHMIENNMMAYVGAKPWHGLGFEVPVGATGQQMLEIAGFNWLVQRRAFAMRSVNADGTVDRDYHAHGGIGLLSRHSSR